MRKEFRIYGLVFALVLLVLGGGFLTAQAKKATMGITLISYYNPFFIALKDGAKEAMDKVGGTLLESDSQQDVSKQIDAVESFIARKVDVILLNAVDSKGVIPAVEAANKAKIPVVTVDNDASGGNVATLVASDNILAGKLCAQYMVDRFKKEKGKVSGNVVILDALPVTGVLQRLQGFYSVIKDFPEVRIVTTQNAQGNRSEGLTVMENVLQGFPQIDCVFAINDPSGLGALSAIEAAGREGDMFIVSVDGAKDAYQAIKRVSAFAFTAAQDPKAIGRIGVEMALKAMKGQKLPRFTAVPVNGVTIENVDEYLSKATF
jgi:ribose transport system substrate-binding protein